MISFLALQRWAEPLHSYAKLNMSLQNDFVADIDEELLNPTDKRIFAIASAFHRGYTVDKIWQMTNIDKWFLSKLFNIHHMEMRLG